MMLNSLSRRRRNVAYTSVIGSLLLLLCLGVIWILSSSAESYRPGQDVEGLTDDLARTLPADYPRVVFTDMTESAGIAFTHFHGTRTSQLPEDMGSGAAWGD